MAAPLILQAIPKPVRIARIITRLGIGGVERHICSLTANLNREKFGSWVIAGRPEKSEREWVEFAAEAGVEPVFIDLLRRKLGLWDLAASFKLNRVLTQIQPHIIETHQSKAGALARAIVGVKFRGNGPRPRLIHTFHGHQFQGYFKSPSVRAFLAIERRLARLTDLIITVTPTIRRQLVEYYQIASADKVRVVPLGFDFAWLRELAHHRGWLRAHLEVPNSTVIFGTVGRLTKIKNVELQLRAFAQMLRQTTIDARLVVIGDGELRAALQSLARDLEISDRVLFCGWILDRAKIFCDLDVTCLSSFNEGSPVCLIESLVAGVPVVATAVGGIPDVVSSVLDGELVPSCDEEAFAAALTRAANCRRRISAKRSAAVRREYSTVRLINDMESLYAELLQDNRACSLGPQSH
jgi:glycosyltransferase involved in cell wall biosynthesis